jgi:hypothetical protein
MQLELEWLDVEKKPMKPIERAMRSSASCDIAYCRLMSP